MIGRKKAEETVRGRAWVAPTGTKNELGNADNVSADGRVRCRIGLKPLSAVDGRPVDESLQSVSQDLPNWLARSFYCAGSGEDLARQLPDRIEVDVEIGVDSRRVVSLDVEQAIADLAPYRAAAVDDWKHEGSVLAPVRNVLAAPKQGWKAVRGIKGSIKEAADSLKPTDPSVGPKPSYKPDEVAQIRTQATIMALRFEKHPKEKPPIRASALQGMPMYVQMYLTGAIHADDFDVEVMRHEVSTAITTDEAAEFRRQTGRE